MSENRTTESETKDAVTSAKVDLTGRGWEILRFIGFEVEVFSNKVARGKFVVNERSCQPFGVLHGGTTAFIAESIGSIAGAYASNFQHVVGVELNVNHLRPVTVGNEVVVTATPFLLGSRLQVWEVKFETERRKKSENEPTPSSPELVLAAVSRLTLMVGASKTDSLDTRIKIAELAGLGQLNLKAEGE